MEKVHLFSVVAVCLFYFEGMCLSFSHTFGSLVISDLALLSVIIGEPVGV